MSPYALGIIYVLLAGACFGFLGIFGRLAYGTGLEVSSLLFWRFFIAACLLWIFALVFRPKIFRLDTKQILISLGLGILGYALFSSFYFHAIKYLSVSLAALILFTFPLFVSLIEHFVFNQTLRALQWFSLFITLLGLALLLSDGWNFESTQGVLYGFAAAITYSLYVVASGKVQKNVHPLSSSLYVITGATLALGLFHRVGLTQAFEFSGVQWGLVLGIAIISTIAPLSLFLAGLQRLPSSTASILVTVEPIVATFAAAVLLEETLTFKQYFATAIVLLGTTISGLRHKRTGARWE